MEVLAGLRTKQGLRSEAVLAGPQRGRTPKASRHEQPGQTKNTDSPANSELTACIFNGVPTWVRFCQMPAKAK
jgi:hypothetical protein